MPYVRAMVLDNEELITLLDGKGPAIREVVARCARLKFEEIAFVPEIKTGADAKLADNMLPLEFVVEYPGALNNAGQVSEGIKAELLKLVGFEEINFGVCTRVFLYSAFTEHKPTA